MAVLMVFVDGLGLGGTDPSVNPLARPELSWLREFTASGAVLDCRLDMPGLPQSATGQTAIYTGINAARAIGRHREGLPCRSLIAIIEKANIFAYLVHRGYSCTFANAYRWADPDRIRRRSVTTVMTLSALGTVRDLDDLRNGRAVYQDITNARLIRDGWGVEPAVPADAAEVLAALACRHDLTLFEYFMTDRAGHTGSMAEAVKVLGCLQEFLQAVTAAAERDGTTVILCSDHGNIEDMSVRTHTLNPVPLAAAGPGSSDVLSGIFDLTGIHDRLVTLITGRSARGDSQKSV